MRQKSDGHEYYYPLKGITQLDNVTQMWESFDNKHSALGLESLVSNLLKISGERQILFNSHIYQALNIIRTEAKRMYSGYENAFGQKCSGIKRFKNDVKVLKTFNYGNIIFVLIENLNPLECDGVKYDILTLNSYCYVQNKTGYSYFNVFSDESVDYAGNVYKKGDVYQFTSFYDENNDYNFQYGRNLKTIYKSYNGLTMEDAIVISESAAESMAHNVIEVKEIKINPKNQILDNLFGGYDLKTNKKKPKKYFPNTNEEVKDDGTYLVVRNIEDAVKGIMASEDIIRPFTSDDVYRFYPGTIIEDIMVDTNMEYNKLAEYNPQIASYVREKENGIYRVICDDIHNLITNNNVNPHNDLSYNINNYLNRISQEISNTNYTNSNKNEEDYITLKIVLKYRKAAVIGSKITDHYGSKGVVSRILPDYLMPMDKYGRRAEIILNPYGSMNRMNPAQLYEQGLNYISDVLVINAKDMNPLDAYDYLTSYIEMVNSDQSDLMDIAFATDKLKIAWVKELTSGQEELCLNMEPFNDFHLDDVNKICDKFGIEQIEISGQIKNGIIGDKYYIKLVQDPDHSISYRGIGIGNANSLPTRAKNDTVIHINTPIRLGTEELANLTLNAIYDFNRHKEFKINELIRKGKGILNDEQIAVLTKLSDAYNYKNSFTNKMACDMTHHPLDEFKMINNSSITAREEYIKHAIKGDMCYPNIDPDNIGILPIPSQLMENLVNIYGSSIDASNPIYHKIARDRILNGLE